MKKILITLIILNFFLFGCQINNSSKNKVSNDDIFEKKKNCAMLREEIENLIKEANKDPLFNNQESVFNKIFYSTRKNSCLYVKRTYSPFPETLVVAAYLIDALTNEELENDLGCFPTTETCTKSLFDLDTDFESLIAEYQ